MTISNAKYVSITTYRRSGEEVSSPVWIAPLANGTAGFTTNLDSGKVKRIRNNPTVALRICSVRGRVAPDAEIVTASARVVTGAEVTAVQRAIINKYGIIGRALAFSEQLTARLRSSKPSNAAAILLQFDSEPKI